MTRVRRIGRATFASLHNRNYRLYFTGQIISVSGTWMQRLAQAWLVLSLTDNNGVWLGVETGLQFLPMLLFGAWGGVIADRFDKRKLLYCTQTAAGLLALGLALVVWTDTATLPIVFVFSVLLGFTNVFVYADPSRDLAVSLMTTGKPALSLEVWYPTGYGDDVRGAQAYLAVKTPKAQYKNDQGITLPTSYLAFRAQEQHLDELRVRDFMLLFGVGFN